MLILRIMLIFFGLMAYFIVGQMVVDSLQIRTMRDRVLLVLGWPVVAAIMGIAFPIIFLSMAISLMLKVRH